MKHHLYLAMAPLLMASAAACSSSKDEPTPDIGTLPDGTYPVEYTGSLSHYSTHAADRIELAPGQLVTIQSTPASTDAAIPAWDEAHTAPYTLATDGTVMPCSSTPAYWTHKSQQRHVRAWLTDTDGNHQPNTHPTDYTLPADQSAGVDTHHFMYATAVASYGEATELNFLPQLAKLRVNIRFEGTAAAYHTIRSTTIGDATTPLHGLFTAPTGSAPYGTWQPQGLCGSITPHILTEAPAGFSHSAEALLIPHTATLQGTVTLSDGRNLRWQTQATTQFSPGGVSVADVTVSADLTQATVQLSQGSHWAQGSDDNVVSSPVMPDYGEVHIGDYYYSDGSWSYGGFIGFDTSGHGSVQWQEPRPQPQSTNPITGNQRSVIGIVFSTDPARLGQAELATLQYMGIEPHGQVMSLVALTNQQWDSQSSDDTQVGIAYVKGAPGDPLFPKILAHTSGLQVMDAILSGRAAEINQGRFGAVSTMRSLSAPATATPWSIPAGGQWLDMLRNFIGMDFSQDSPFYFAANQIDKEDGTHFDFQLDMTLAMIAEYHEDFVEMINQSMAAVPSGLKTEFALNQNYLTSTMCDSGNLYYMAFMPKFISFRRVAKTNWLTIRPVLAF